MAIEMYLNGEYLAKNPTWDVEHSPWKAKQILRMLTRNNLLPKTICEVGCGFGEILVQLQKEMEQDCVFYGYEISRQAFEHCKQKSNERLHFRFEDISTEKETFFDVILLVDLIEHLEDYFAFLRKLKSKSQYTIFHIPLDLSVQTVLRISPILRDRKQVGHINYFTMELALQTLVDVGYEVLDYFYTAASVDLPVKSIKRRLLKWPRRLLFAANEDLAARVLGGYSLLVLAK